MDVKMPPSLHFGRSLTGLPRMEAASKESCRHRTFPAVPKSIASLLFKADIITRIGKRNLGCKAIKHGQLANTNSLIQLSSTRYDSRY